MSGSSVQILCHVTQETWVSGFGGLHGDLGSCGSDCTYVFSSDLSSPLLWESVINTWAGLCLWHKPHRNNPGVRLKVWVSPSGKKSRWNRTSEKDTKTRSALEAGCPGWQFLQGQRQLGRWRPASPGNPKGLNSLSRAVGANGVKRRKAQALGCHCNTF